MTTKQDKIVDFLNEVGPSTAGEIAAGVRLKSISGLLFLLREDGRIKYSDLPRRSETGRFENLYVSTGINPVKKNKSPLTLIREIMWRKGHENKIDDIIKVLKAHQLIP